MEKLAALPDILATYAAHFAQILAVIIVFLGVLRSCFMLLAPLPDDKFTIIRSLLSRHLALGLEFLLAADIISTTIDTSWTHIGQLASIALIRTFLNFFLIREMQDAKTM